MGCCSSLDNFSPNSIVGTLLDFFDGEHVQSVGVAIQPIMPLNSEQPNAMLKLRKTAKALDSSIAKEMSREYTSGKFFRITSALRYLRNNSTLDGEPKFKVLGDTQDFRDFLLDLLATESGVVGATASDVSMNNYSDSVTATMNMLAYKYIHSSPSYYGSWNNDNVFNFSEVIDTNAIDFAHAAPRIQLTTNDTSVGSSNEVTLAIDLDLLITNIWAMDKVTVDNPNALIQIIVLELEDTSNGDIFYHELRPLHMLNDDDNQLLVHYSVNGGDCCYYFEYQFGSNVYPQLEDATNQQFSNSYSTFSLFPIIPLKYDGLYVADMKYTNPQRYKDTNKLCNKIGFPLKYLNAIIQERGNTPDEQAQADTAHSQTQDTFLEYTLNIDRDSQSNAKSLWWTAKLIKDHTTTHTSVSAEGQTDENYLFSISHDDTSISRYNKNIRIGTISKSTHVGNYSVRESDTESTVLKRGKYSREKFLVHQSSELLPDGSNGHKQYQAISNPRSYYEYYKAVLRLVKQDDTSYTIYDIETIENSTVVEDDGDKKGVNYNMIDSFDYSDNIGITITMPLFAEIVNKLNYSEQYNLYNECLHLINFASVDTHLQFYETEAFIKGLQVALIVVAVIILYDSIGGGYELSAYLVALAIGLGGSIALNYLLKKVESPWLKAILVIAYVALMVYSGNVTSDGSALMLLASTAIQAVSIDYKQKMLAESESYKRYMKDLIASTHELEEKQKQFIKPEILDDIEILNETPDQFYQRVLNTDAIESVRLLSEDFMSSSLDKYLDLDNMYIQK